MGEGGKGKGRKKGTIKLVVHVGKYIQCNDLYCTLSRYLSCLVVVGRSHRTPWPYLSHRPLSQGGTHSPVERPL